MADTDNHSLLQKVRRLPRNVWAASACSLLTDVSSEMLLNLLPLFLANVLGIGTAIIGLVEGVAESMASLIKVFSGWLSDRVGNRKWLAVIGYGFSAVVKPLFYFANAWGTVATARWLDRVGKGIRTAPRDALLADSINPEQRGITFGVHRTADTAGAAIGVSGALLAVWLTQAREATLAESTFRTVVLLSIIPAFLAVLVLALGAREPEHPPTSEQGHVSIQSLGRSFFLFMLIIGLFELGNSSDAFLILRAQERGLSVVGVLAMLLTFNLICSVISTPGGSLSDTMGRRPLIITGWLAYAVIYLGFALAQVTWHIWLCYALYGVYYGLAYGTAKAMVSDLVPVAYRGTAYGFYSGVMGIMAFPASLVAGILWQGIGSWGGLGPSAPFFFGAALALVASLLLALWSPAKPGQ